MSKTINDGGSAFSVGGMSLRDYFAINADVSGTEVNSMETAERITGRPLPKDHLEQIDWQAEIVAMLRYRMADAMLRARGERT